MHLPHYGGVFGKGKKEGNPMPSGGSATSAPTLVNHMAKWGPGPFVLLAPCVYTQAAYTSIQDRRKSRKVRVVSGRRGSGSPRGG